MKWTKTILLVVMVTLLAYKSLYFENLAVHRSSLLPKEFNPSAYAQNFWNTKLIPNLGKAVELSQLSEMLSMDPEKAFAAHSHALGIGNLRYFLVKGAGVVESINDDNVVISIQNEKGRQSVSLETEFIFGNAVRDATGLININEFNNTMDFNNVSAQINQIIREKVLPRFKKEISVGRQVEFVGAIELNKEHIDKAFKVIPIQLALR